MSRPGGPRFNARLSWINALGGGANIGDIWHCAAGVGLSGAAITGWTGQYRGLVLTPNATSARPTYAADGSNFRGQPVVQCAKSNLGMLQNTGLSLGSSSDVGHLVVIGRTRVDPTGTDYDHIGIALSSTVGRYLTIQQASSSHAWAQITFTSHGNFTQTPTNAVDTAPHLFDLGNDAASNRTWIDGIDGGGAGSIEAATMESPVSTLQIGANTSGRGSEFSFALFAYLFSQPTSAQRATLRELARAEFGF